MAMIWKQLTHVSGNGNDDRCMGLIHISTYSHYGIMTYRMMTMMMMHIIVHMLMHHGENNECDVESND